jgi:hypothetical protein
MARREARPRRRSRSVVVVSLLLAGSLAVARTREGAVAVEWLRGFLEFYSGVFALVALSMAVVAGVVAAQRVPVRFRILAQAAHRATAFMAVGFLAAHIVLKIMEAHAAALDAVVPFAGHRGVYVGLGTIASDVLIVVLATGVLRGRFVALSHPWIWRAVHTLAYAMWPLAIYHGLTSGRRPAAWVVWSYLVCFAFATLVAASRLPRASRDRRMVRARPAPPRTRPQRDVPDAEFWASLRAETAGWIGDRR